MTHELPPLPYPENALEPRISRETLQYHHGKHHRTYVDNLNKLIPGTEFADSPLETVIAKAKGPIFNNAAQVWNHTSTSKGSVLRNTLIPKGNWHALCPASSVRSMISEKPSTRRRPRSSERAGPGSSSYRAGSSTFSRPAMPKPRSAKDSPARSSPVTCGSMPTTSITGTHGPSISNPSGNSSTGIL